MYPVTIKLPWSDCVEEKVFEFLEWGLPIPRKGEAIRLFATYTGERLKELIVKDGKTLCVFHVERVTYTPEVNGVEIQVSFTVPVMGN